MLEYKGKEKKKSYAQIQLGTSSLVLIFTVLCLVVFSTLSLASSKADQKLAEKNQRSVSDYYEADGKAEEILKTINESVLSFAKQSTNATQFQKLVHEKYGSKYEVEKNRLNYAVEVNHDQVIMVCLQLFNFDQVKDNQKSYNIVSWIVQNKVDYEVDDSIPVWDGE